MRMHLDGAGIDHQPFKLCATPFGAIKGERTQTHINESRVLLSKAGGGGFPAFVIEQDGLLSTIDVSAFFGQPDSLRKFLESQV